MINARVKISYNDWLINVDNQQYKKKKRLPAHAYTPT